MFLELVQEPGLAASRRRSSNEDLIGSIHFWCDGVTACDKKITKKYFARALIKKLLGFAVTPCHTGRFCHTAALVVRNPEPHAQPHANLRRTPSAIGSYPILLPTQSLQPIIKQPF